jgi:heptosyltransferase-1
MQTYLNHEFRAFKRALQGVHYDLVIDAQGLIKSGLISRLSRGMTIGLSNRTIREPFAALFYNKAYSVPWTEHAVDRVRELFSRALNYDYQGFSLDYGLALESIGNEGQDFERQEIIFLHGTTRESKYWPEKKWRELANKVTDRGYDVILPWGDEGEKERAGFIAKDNADVKILDRQSLSELAKIISRSKGVVAVDTGLGHLAAALSKPTVSLYGPTNPKLCGTYGVNQVHLGLEKDSNFVWDQLESLINSP